MQTPLSLRARRLLAVGRQLSSSIGHGSSSILHRYDGLIASGSLRDDPQQRELAGRLSELHSHLEIHAGVAKRYADSIRAWRADVRAIEASHEAAVRRATNEWNARPIWQRAVASLVGLGPAAPWDAMMTPSGSFAVGSATREEMEQRMPDVVPVPRMPRHHAETDSEAGSFGGESIGGGACSGKNAACGGSSGGSTLPADPPLSAQTLMSAPGHEPPESSTLDAPTRLVSPDELSEAERNHPFWRSGIGASALQRVQADEEGDRDGRGGASGGGTNATNGVGGDEDKSAMFGAYLRSWKPPPKPALPPPPLPPPPPPRGLFIYGDVGAGKTLLMDLFADAVRSDRMAGGEAVAPVRLRRVHFNAFITECHRRLHAHSCALSEIQAAERASSSKRGAPSPLPSAASGEDDHGAGMRAARFRVAPSSPSSSSSSFPLPSRASSPRPWDAVAELVRKFVVEPDAPEHGSDLGEALDCISTSILESSEDDAESRARHVASAAADAVLEDDPHGRPVSAGVLCFDEVQMMDIADATIVSGVLSRLFDAGWVLVATCNRTPEEFASSTMHREHPQARFTARVMECCDTAHLRTPTAEDGTALDYRQTLRPCVEEPTYLSPLTSDTIRAVEQRFARELAGAEASLTSLRIGAGRSLHLEASDAHGVARTSFEQLCAATLGAEDYIALAQKFHTIFLTDVPQLSLQHRDQARRFITLVDQLYNHRTKLVTTAEVELPRLFSGTSGGGHVAQMNDMLEGLEFEGEAGKVSELNPIGVSANSLATEAAARLADTAKVGADTRKRLLRDSLFTGEDEVFAFRRALSRLQEMGSVEYLARAGRARVSF
jgi:predicted ATPase